MLDRTYTALPRLGLAAPPGRGRSWVWRLEAAGARRAPPATVVVEGKRTDVFQWSDGRRVTGQELLTRADWPWRDSLQLPRRRYVRLTATSPTFGPVTVVIVKEPSQECYDLLCQATSLTAPRLIRAWKRRSWIEHSCRTLTHLLATDACQVHGKMPTTGIWCGGCWPAWCCSTPPAGS